MVDEGLLYWMQRAVFSEAFDCRYLRAVLHHGQRQAGIDPAAIHQNSTGAALAVVATFLCSGQAEMNPERVKQSSPGSDSQLVRYAVDVKRDRHFYRQTQIFCWFANRWCSSHLIVPPALVGRCSRTVLLQASIRCPDLQCSGESDRSE